MGLRLRDVSHRKTQNAGVGLTTSWVGSYRTSCSLRIYKWLCSFSDSTTTIGERAVHELSPIIEGRNLVGWVSCAGIKSYHRSPQSVSGLCRE